jgi:hypothetical protein
MRGGDLEIKNICGNEAYIPAKDFGLWDAIQVRVAIFEIRNLQRLSAAATSGANSANDEGFTREEDKTEIEDAYKRWAMYRRMNAALGRVQVAGLGVRVATLEEWRVLEEAIVDQGDGRAGVEYPHMWDYAEEIRDQITAYKDIHRYEGEILPVRIPIVLEQDRWDSIDNAFANDYGWMGWGCYATEDEMVPEDLLLP